MTHSFDTGETERGVFSVDGFDLQYLIEGRGPPLLVIGSAVYYPRTFSAALRDHFRMIFIDHRGFARCHREVAPADAELPRIVQDVDRLRAHLGLDRVDILGHSGHGYMALEYARAYPERVGRTVAVATGPSHAPHHMAVAERLWQELVAPERKRIFEEDMARLPADIAAGPQGRFVHMCLRLGARSWFDPQFDARPLWEGVQVNMPIFDRLWGETFRDLDMEALLTGIRAPVLLALGRFDYLVAPAETWNTYRDFARDLTVRLFERSAHTPQLEEGAEFDRVLVEFLTR